jgi:hypothetical protein
VAGMRSKKKKGGGTTYTYSGDLAECIEKSEKELKEKRGSQQQLFLLWQYQNAKKAYDNFNKRIDDLENFIRLGKEELKRRKERGEDGTERDT